MRPHRVPARPGRARAGPAGSPRRVRAPIHARTRSGSSPLAAAASRPHPCPGVRAPAGDATRTLPGHSPAPPPRARPAAPPDDWRRTRARNGSWDRPSARRRRPPAPPGRRPAGRATPPGPAAAAARRVGAPGRRGTADGPATASEVPPAAGSESRSTSAAYGRSRSVARPVMDKTMSPSDAAARAAVARTAVLPSPGMPRTTAVREPSPSSVRSRVRADSRPTSPSSSPAHSPTPGPATPRW